MSKIIDTSEPNRASGGRFKKPAIIVGVVLLLFSVGAVALMLKPGLNPLSKDTAPDKPATAEEMYDRASELASTKGAGEAGKYYDEQVAATGDKEVKLRLLLDKSSVAYNAGDYDAALKAAQEADAIKSTTGTVSAIAQAYEAKGDKTNALDYYKKALASLPKSEVTNREEVSLKSKIEELSQ